MTLIDKETIRAEIERRIENCVKNVRHQPCHRIEELCELLSFLDTLPEQPVEGLEEEIDACWQNWLSPSNQKEVEGVLPKTEFATYARHFAEWGAEHAVAPHYFELRELKTGRVFLAEWSDIAGEWYERGNGKAHQSDEVEIVQHAKK